MSHLFAPRILVATSLVFALGIGCGSAGGGGCGGLKPLPADPKPLGFPSDQVIEGGIQARITKPGMDKLTATIPALFHKMLGNGLCVSGKRSFTIADACDANDCPGGAQGCPAFIYFDSKDRPSTATPDPPYPPAAAGNQDGKDRIIVTLNDSSPTQPPTITVDATFDVLAPLHINPLIGSGCYVDLHTDHVAAGSTADPLHILAHINLGIDPATGELTMHLAPNNGVEIPSLNLTTSSGGGFACDLASGLFAAVLGFVNSIPGFITQFIINLLTPTLDNLLQSFLPKPLGIAGVMNTGKLLAKFHPPADANLEMFIVGGGYVASSAGGLTLGVMSGLNSDRDETTRAPGLTSEPSLCVPSRPTPDLAVAPWMLPLNTQRKDFTLQAAGPFAGMPDPTDATGMLQDVALGISRTFFDLAGFHIYNSGTLCLAIGGDALPQLNAGTLSVIVGSLGNILDDRKAPLALVLRPQVPLSFTIGAGNMTDPLIHVAVDDLRIDFYAWIEERYARILTLSLDMNVGLNLTVTTGADMKAAIQPMLTGIDANNVKIRVSNTDLLQEDPKALEKVFPSLLSIATGALGGVVKPIALPSVMGFSLDNLQINKVQTSQDDFLGIFGTIKTGTPTALVDWSDPQHPHLAGGIRTRAAVASVDVPSQAQLHALFDSNAPMLHVDAARPRVTLDLGAEDTTGRPVEFGYRVDGGMWHTWSTETHPVVADDAFLLQGRHVLEVRSRIVDEWTTEDLHPVSLDVLIDSVAPELHPQKDPSDATRLSFGGFDIVSDSKALKYAWRGLDGKQTAWTSDDGLSLDEARRLTADGEKPLVIYAQDEAGNVGEAAPDLSLILGFHGRTTNPPAAGCGCTVGGASGDGNAPLAGLVAIALGLLVLLRGRTATKKILAALALAALGTVVAGCGCDNKGLQCQIDDDCAKMQCTAGQLPQCQSNMCVCTADVDPGNMGRFSSMALDGPNAYVAAYNSTYGDLVIGHVTPPGIITNWDWVDGVPDVAPDVTASHVRGGVMQKGDDVGRYTSIQITPAGDPIIAYYDKTHGALKFASFGAIRWHSYTVDKGVGSPEGGGDDVGRWASMSIGPDGTPAIAYIALAQSGTISMKPEGQLRWAQAKVPNPLTADDWTISIVDSRPLPDPNAVPDGGAPPPPVDGGGATPPTMTDPLLPESIALMPAVARKMDGTPGIAYYDRTRGNLRFVEFNKGLGKWGTPVLLDGEDMMGKDTADVGMYPSLNYDDKDVANISYVDATHDNLLYVNGMTLMPEVVDDGYRPKAEQTLDGLDSPVFHLVGDSSSIQTVAGQVVIAYQDSTVEQLRVAQKGMDGKWTLSTVAGHAMPFKGSYGFYANLRIANRQGIISSYAINQHLETPLFYVEIFSIDLGLIM